MAPSSLTPEERETVYTENDGENIMRIFTHQRKRITQLKKNKGARLIEEGKYGSTAWAQFEIDANLITFRNPRPPKPMTEEEKQAVADRFAKARAVARSA